MTKLAQSRWLDIGLVLILRFSSWSIKTHIQKNEANILAILASLLVNNTYVHAMYDCVILVVVLLYFQGAPAMTEEEQKKLAEQYEEYQKKLEQQREE